MELCDYLMLCLPWQVIQCDRNRSGEQKFGTEALKSTLHSSLLHLPALLQSEALALRQSLAWELSEIWGAHQGFQVTMPQLIIRYNSESLSYVQENLTTKEIPNILPTERNSLFQEEIHPSVKHLPERYRLESTSHCIYHRSSTN